MFPKPTPLLSPFLLTLISDCFRFPVPLPFLPPSTARSSTTVLAPPSPSRLLLWRPSSPVATCLPPARGSVSERPPPDVGDLLPAVSSFNLQDS
ncbi:hypothetical protein RJT34_31358 [Clitoria ternatea]|uniref:Uncharacterized protein n=1 Tax=Clitoria ternatea TaxID=43366 RepID=A0AAN9EWA6_CLITE